VRTDGQTDEQTEYGQTHKTKLIVAFQKFANPAIFTIIISVNICYKRKFSCCSGYVTKVMRGINRELYMLYGVMFQNLVRI